MSRSIALKNYKCFRNNNYTISLIRLCKIFKNINFLYLVI